MPDIARDLFDHADKLPAYPEGPGYSEETTSRDAAVAIAPSVSVLRGQVLAIYRTAYPEGLTADEAAKKVGRNILSIRPRVTELRKSEDLVPMRDAELKTITRRNESGVNATVLVWKGPNR